ncbi:RNA polymerase sigma factor SigF [Phaeacidiphilus oryzae]|uniref:RNA polymerase sigma factor SigF n=1 Tax=Phaeacidiphilus oryzae TaxID=348818 RepID=UPI000A02D905|nr:RNA polymerase sigma factor SigF [Phaeacidiphilus oryzae]
MATSIRTAPAATPVRHPDGLDPAHAAGRAPAVAPPPGTGGTGAGGTGGTGADGGGMDGLPEVSDPSRVAPADARELSREFFVRLAELEEGTHEYQYVRNTLIELNLALVKFAARRFATRSEPMDDIVQVGTIGLIKAIDRFDPSYGVEFPTFAMPTVIGEIKRFFRDTSWAVRVPRRLQELRLALARASDDLEQRFGRPPTVRELAERLGLEEDEIVEGLSASNAYTAASLDAAFAGDTEEDAQSSLEQRIGFDEPALEGIENLHSLKPLIAELPERERTILELRFRDELTQSQIGERLGISQMHVSRLLSRTLSRLREGLLTDGDPGEGRRIPPG